MLAPLITLLFLLALWASAVVIAEMLGNSGSRILAAFHGKARASGTGLTVRMPPRRTGYARSFPMRARLQLRAAA
jgi:hypothetical protein